MPLANSINIKRVLFISVACTLWISNGCKKDEPIASDRPLTLNIPVGFPPMNIPADNQLTVKRVELGKMLFFDKALSADSSIACASCHFPDKGFSDIISLSLGIKGNPGIRNSPPLGNIGYHDRFFRDGGVPTLEQQVLAPIADKSEMNFSIAGVVERLKQNQTYVTLSGIAYGREPDAFVVTRAIAAFERTLITGNSPFDKYQYHGVESALNESEKRGMALFNSTRTNCSGCHSGFNVTNLSFRNIGLYETYADTGRKRITQLDEDYGKFKVPSLRNVEVTGPYMHDGSIHSLEDVINHYDIGGKENPYKDPFIKPIGLTKEEKDDLINFLKSLTDNEFLQNPAFSQ